MENQKKNPKVTVREIKTTSDPQLVQLALEQKLPRKVDNTSALLNITMAGHSAFGNSEETRVVYQNFSKQQVESLGLKVGAALPKEWNAKLVVHELLQGEEIPEALRGFYPGKESFEPNTWTDKISGEPRTQAPKQTPDVDGQPGQVLVVGDQPIYRNTFLTIDGMPQEDLLKRHTNTVSGSNAAVTATEQEAGVGQNDRM